MTGHTDGVKYALAWVVAAVVATGLGVLGVAWTVDRVQIRGPIGDHEAIRSAELGTASPSPDSGQARVDEEITGEWGTFVVGCRGVYAYGVDTRPAPGWTVISVEPGPDDDVDAVFANEETSVDIEVFCNRGSPTVAEIERHERP